MPALPEGGLAKWTVDGVQEIVCYAVFDPKTVAPLVPQELRFIRVDELAAGGVQWAKDHLDVYPAHSAWGVSFLEIVRSRVFSIAGREPRLPTDGAVALWCARVALTGNQVDAPRPFLILGFWVPDQDYAEYMRQKGYYATFGQVTLARQSDGSWIGSIRAENLSVAAVCRPEGLTRGGEGAAGTQSFFPPANSSLRNYVRVVFAGHREQECSETSSWTITGTHPLAYSTVLKPYNFQYGYRLSGAVFQIK